MRVLYCPVFDSQGKTLKIWGLVKTPKDMICAPLIKTVLENSMNSGLGQVKWRLYSCSTQS